MPHNTYTYHTTRALQNTRSEVYRKIANQAVQDGLITRSSIAPLFYKEHCAMYKAEKYEIGIPYSIHANRIIAFLPPEMVSALVAYHCPTFGHSTYTGLLLKEIEYWSATERYSNPVEECIAICFLGNDRFKTFTKLMVKMSCDRLLKSHVRKMAAILGNNILDLMDKEVNEKTGYMRPEYKGPYVRDFIPEKYAIITDRLHQLACEDVVNRELIYSAITDPFTPDTYTPIAQWLISVYMNWDNPDSTVRGLTFDQYLTQRKGQSVTISVQQPVEKLTRLIAQLKSSVKEVNATIKELEDKMPTPQQITNAKTEVSPNTNSALLAQTLLELYDTAGLEGSAREFWRGRTKVTQSPVLEPIWTAINEALPKVIQIQTDDFEIGKCTRLPLDIHPLCASSALTRCVAVGQNYAHMTSGLRVCKPALTVTRFSRVSTHASALERTPAHALLKRKILAVLANPRVCVIEDGIRLFFGIGDSFAAMPGKTPLGCVDGVSTDLSLTIDLCSK